jgi:hypothetical protein
VGGVSGALECIHGSHTSYTLASATAGRWTRLMMDCTRNVTMATAVRAANGSVNRKMYPPADSCTAQQPVNYNDSGEHDWGHDTRHGHRDASRSHNTTQAQHKDNTTQHDTTQHNTTQHDTTRQARRHFILTVFVWICDAIMQTAAHS